MPSRYSAIAARASGRMTSAKLDAGIPSMATRKRQFRNVTGVGMGNAPRCCSGCNATHCVLQPVTAPHRKRQCRTGADVLAKAHLFEQFILTPESRVMPRRFPNRRELCQAAKRTAADIEGHSEAAKFGQPRRLSARKSAWRLTPEKYRGASHRADRHPKDQNGDFRIPPVFLHFALSLSLKIVWVARSDQVQLPSVADSPQAQHRLRRELAVEVL